MNSKKIALTSIIIFLLLTNIILVFKLVNCINQNNKSINTSSQNDALHSLVRLKSIKVEGEISNFINTKFPKIILIASPSDCESCLIVLSDIYRKIIKNSKTPCLLLINESKTQTDMLKFQIKFDNIKSIYRLINIEFYGNLLLKTPSLFFLDENNNIIYNETIQPSFYYDESLLFVRLRFLLR